VRSGLPPVVAIFVETEGPVVVRIFADSFEEEERAILDLELRPDVLDEIALAIDRMRAERGRAA
jgi:hypothetical protein